MVRGGKVAKPKRTDRVAELVRMELSELLSRGVKDPRVSRHIVTLTSVDASPDLRHVNVYVSAMVSPAERNGVLDGLRSAAGYLRRELGRRVSMKYTPELRFVWDASLDAGARVEQLLDQLQHESVQSSSEFPAKEEAE